MSAPQEIESLVEKFREHSDSVHSPEYKEVWTREEYIDPLLNVLGWHRESVTSQSWNGYIPEDRLQAGESSRAPDYGCYVDGELAFYVEAKKPSLRLDRAADAAIQLRRYGWNARLTISVLTNFESLAIYDCRLQPADTDISSISRRRLISCDDYVKEWDWISSLLSRESVAEDSILSWAQENKAGRTAIPIDQAFLGEIEGWRERLASDIAMRNPSLDQRHLTSVVQALLDRIIFLRIAEARGIEQEGDLQQTIANEGAYSQLFSLFERADARFNSGLFHFRREAGRDQVPDLLAKDLVVSDRELRSIIGRLYPPSTPYEFSTLPAAVIGQVYEEFLGKVLEVDSDRSVSVIDKPEVKKAGGVVYTPVPVVRYIVQQTLAREVSGKTPRQVGGETRARDPIRVLDPACGSGSFLMEVFDFFLRWYLDTYSKNPQPWLRGANPRLIEISGEYRLTTRERKRILTTHIYGVDIDRQAVEVTKLALLLKVLEGETDRSLRQQMSLFHERALPDLDRNIRCGNSLIATDFARVDPSVFAPERRLVINPFDWTSEFSEVLGPESASPGFHVVLGNPPYVLLQDEFRDDSALQYYREHYAVASGKIDTYHLFMERAIRLTRPGGWCSMITPSNYLTNNSLESLRHLIVDSTKVDHIAILDSSVFPKRSVDCAVYVVSPGGPTVGTFELRHLIGGVANLKPREIETVDVSAIRSRPSFLLVGTGATSIDWDHIGSVGRTLGDLAWVNFGKQLRNRKVYTEDVLMLEPDQPLPDGYRRCYTGSDVAPWSVVWGGLACLESDEAQRGGCWDPDRQDANNKLLTRQIGKAPAFGIDLEGYQCLNTIFMVNLKPDAPIGPYGLLAILNSLVVRGFWVERFWDRRRTFPKIKGTYLKELPIATPDTSLSDSSIFDEIEILGRRAVELASEGSSDGDETKTRLLSSTELEINIRVCGLYGLSDQAIADLEVLFEPSDSHGE